MDRMVHTALNTLKNLSANRNVRAQNMGKLLLSDSGWGKLSIQKTDGNWDDKRMGIRI